jgi:putative membrane protein
VKDPHHPGGATPGPPPGELGFLLDTGAVLVWLGLAALYLLAGRAAVLRGRVDWPAHRTASWLAGAGLGLAVTTAPHAGDANAGLTAHMAVHLVLSMLVPTLLVLGAPVALGLRAVPVHAGRRFSRLARAAPVRLLSHPVMATVLSTLPMALLYWDGSGLALLHEPVLGPALHVHFVAAGALFAYAVVGLDPNPHRARASVRGSMIVLSIAVHGIVAKHLYSVGDQRGLPQDTEQAAQLMYYGGDALHLLLLVVFCAQVYREGGRRLRRPAQPETAPEPRRVV